MIGARHAEDPMGWTLDVVIVRVNAGKASIYNNLGSTNVIADIQGWFVNPS